MSTFEADGRTAEWGAGHVTARVAALVLLVLVMLGNVWMLSMRAEVPAGCDDFGYMRQAELFRDKGLDGFDTRLTTPAAEQLFKLMRDSGVPAEQWYQAVAPHCHHYRADTGKVILQYPPGTGALMALFPEERQQRLLRIASVVAIAAIFAVLIGMTPNALAAALGIAAAAASMWATAAGSDSVAPATAAAALTGLLLVPALERRNWLALLAFGVVAGLAGSLRVTSLIIPVAAGLVLLTILATERRWINALPPVLLGLGLAVGLAPFGWANWLNTGSVLTTTYSGIDAAAPKLTMEGLGRGLEFYFNLNPSGLLLMGAVAAVLLVFIERPRSPAAGAAFLALLGSLLYLVPKDVLMGYYLIPAATFGLAAVIGLQGSGAKSLASRSITGGVLAAAIVGLGVAFALLRVFGETMVPPTSPQVAEALAGDPMVWADFSTGQFVSGYGAYAAKIGFAGDEVKDRMVGGLAAAGQDQLIVLDDDDMRNVFKRLSTKWTMTLLGQAFGHEVYRIGAATGV